MKDLGISQTKEAKDLNTDETNQRRYQQVKRHPVFGG
jgi:hypothetical protein